MVTEEKSAVEKGGSNENAGVPAKQTEEEKKGGMKKGGNQIRNKSKIKIK